MDHLLDRVQNALDPWIGKSSLTARVLLSIGACWSLHKCWKISSFTRLYFLRRSKLRRYIDGDQQTWALITGASDGIGKGFAEELLSYGVNVVLHGRNEQKLERIKSELRAKWPERQVKLVVLDAANIDGIGDACKPIADLNLRILVNNVGGNGSVQKFWAPFNDRTALEVKELIDINASFPTEITRVLLPQLIQNQPSLVINIGSGASDFACPYLEVFTGAKAYEQAWSTSLRLELKIEKQDVEVLHYQVGMVQSNSAKRETSLLVPSSRQLARAGLNMVGCNRDIVWPYWPHALEFGLIGALPNWLRNRAITDIALKEIAIQNAEDVQGKL